MIISEIQEDSAAPEVWKDFQSVFPESIVMVHLDNGFDKDLYDFNLGVLKDNGAKWDMIGMSLYPYWALDGGFRTDEDQVITDCNDGHCKGVFYWEEH